ncbi:hypothetical protein FRC11_007956 [Ceratobasidium sp. 423]|nr:hypothetical protein FRC11_007956 [Ceratobasidium sp. 423]
MAKYTQRARECQVHPTSCEIPSSSDTGMLQEILPAESSVSTNNAGTGASTIEARPTRDVGIQDALERSNRLAEQTNQLIERSNHIAERANQLVEQSNHPAEQSNRLAERFDQLLERLSQHLEESNRLAKESMQPVEKLGEMLRDTNRLLMRIQHAIVRNHKGNTIKALECLANEKGDTPATSETTNHGTT